MTFLKKAVEQLGIENNYDTYVKYTDQFNEYGSNIRVYPGRIILKLSKSWRPISEEIRIGLAQELLVKIFKLKKNTMNMDLYNGFVKNIHIAVPKEEPEERLLDSFNRVNEKYFAGMIDIPNIVWGDFTLRKLGSYDYRKDTITLSRVLEKREDFIDLVMHHELLHKKHKFNSKNGRSLHHSSKFRKEEHSFENYDELEEELKKYLRKQNFKNMFKFW
ncbi:M48 family metallopeptidase [Candidatus Woesearchaeota archaeon]|nr:M48 family metallopeptidase [Candidatus Woesearchaeota archaeon]